MTIRSAFLTVLTFTSMFAAIGMGTGFALGRFNPGYYRAVFRNGKEPTFDPVAVGIGQGLTQGVTGGALIGLVVVGLFVWRDIRVRRRDAPITTVDDAKTTNPRRRRWVRWLLVVFGCILLLPCGFFSFFMAASVGSSSGSPDLAEEWQDEFAKYAGPAEAIAHDPQVVVFYFHNGDWVFGRAVDSHGVWRRGGGTVVIKDSRGQTRAFFGHVCGGGHLGNGPLGPGSSSASRTLDAFYKQYQESGFVEFPLITVPVNTNGKA